MLTPALREQLLQDINDLAPEDINSVMSYVAFLRSKLNIKQINKPKTKKRLHPARGIWANRQDIVTTESFSDHLREIVEKRQ